MLEPGATERALLPQMIPDLLQLIDDAAPAKSPNSTRWLHIHRSHSLAFDAICLR
jgi:hypothetical protein